MSSELTAKRRRPRYRPGVAPPPERRPRANHRIRRLTCNCEQLPQVVDDLPGIVPIGTAELDVIEIYLGDAINRLLGRVANTPTATAGDDQ